MINSSNNFFEILLLGFIQGTTEFFPVSSSGHLVIGQKIFSIEFPSSSFEILLHFGTLISIFFFFWKEIRKIIIEMYKESLDYKNEKRQFNSVGWMIFVATLPVAFFGLLFEDFFDALFNETKVVGFSLIITGAFLYTSSKFKINVSLEKLNWKHALSLGLMQVFALIPGISRSGFVIAAGIILGMKRTDATKFSLLLGIPTIGGAVIVKSVALSKLNQIPWEGYTIGALTACLTGILAISLLMKAARRTNFKSFAIYCSLAGITTLLFL
ncbi:MAG: undecaprenyl-diphosphate phosphatase [Nitrospinota bacterium]|nr:undecaprenyl-diphosphate phosphatase [Nitrospinota bacterium]